MTEVADCSSQARKACCPQKMILYCANVLWPGNHLYLHSSSERIFKVVQLDYALCELVCCAPKILLSAGCQHWCQIAF